MPAAQKATTWARLQADARPEDAQAARVALHERFALWRGRPERMPRVLERKVLATLGAPAGTRFTDVQRGRTPRGDVWAVRGGAIACVIQDGPGAVVCLPAARVAREGLMLGVYRTGRNGAATRFRALGIVPDGTGTVRFDVGGAARSVPVSGNAYGATAHHPILPAAAAR
ncbi:hypothetical protein [Baekduia sp. Peel2402]|uniref:hypothetical protein n=1 Tax=Baekduia sp. Peel2402 TaxID=3458296 RepID=UPI00403EA857